MQFQGVLFDLDGTLLDTLADIAGAANSVLESLGYPPHPVDAYRLMIGDGVRALLHRALPEDERSPTLIDQLAGDFQAAYAKMWNIHARPFEGVPELLDRLTEQGVTVAVLSNKPHKFTRLCVDSYLDAWPFKAVFGQREGVPRKPDPAAAYEIADLLGLDCEQILYLGDSGTDMLTARNSGMYPVGASWGYRSRDELMQSGAAVVIDRPIQLIDVAQAASVSE